VVIEAGPLITCTSIVTLELINQPRDEARWLSTCSTSIPSQDSPTPDTSITRSSIGGADRGPMVPGDLPVDGDVGDAGPAPPGWLRL